MPRLSRPSPSMVVACVALLVALSGTGYAAVALSKNGVKAKHISKNAVRSSEVKNRSLRAVDFRRNVLRPGPAGVRGAQGVPGPEGPAGPATPATIGAGSIGPDQLGTVPAARASIVPGTSFINLAAQEMPMTDEYDTAAIHPEGESVFVAPRDGVYLAEASLTWPANPTGRRSLVLLHRVGEDSDSVASDSRNAVTGGDPTAQHVATALLMRAGDEIHVAVQQESGGALTVDDAAASLTYLGRAG